MSLLPEINGSNQTPVTLGEGGVISDGDEIESGQLPSLLLWISSKASVLIIENSWGYPHPTCTEEAKNS